MADHAFEWAAKNHLVRQNPIHGEEEANIVLDENFIMEEEEGESYEQNGQLTVEDGPKSHIYADHNRM